MFARAVRRLLLVLFLACLLLAAIAPAEAGPQASSCRAYPAFSYVTPPAGYLPVYRQGPSGQLYFSHFAPASSAPGAADKDHKHDEHKPGKPGKPGEHDHEHGGHLEKSAARSSPFRSRVDHQLNVHDLPQGAKKVQVWFWLPQETSEQHVLGLKVVRKPEKTKVVGDLAGNRYLCAEVDGPAGDITLATQFMLERFRVHADILEHDEPIQTDPETRLAFQDFLQTGKGTGFEVTQRVRDWSDGLKVKPGGGSVAAVHAAYEWVIANTVNEANKERGAQVAPTVEDATAKKVYDAEAGEVRDATPNGFVLRPTAGSADAALRQKGGGSIDQHALLIAAARQRGIPAQLELGAALTMQEAREVTAGHRSVMRYFVPGHGWVLLDAAEAGNRAAEAPTQKRKEIVDFYFSGLDNKHVCFYRGRNLGLTTYDGKTTEPVNLFLHGYVLVDGKPHTKFTPRLKHVVLP